MKLKGCKKCPAFAKCTVTYRSSGCEALRWTYGIDTDPEIITNADRIRSMSDKELEDQLVLEVEGMAPCKMFISIPTGEMFICSQAAKEAVEKWLQQPAEED